MSVLRYKDYQGSVEYDEAKLHLRILHIDDLITTEIDSAAEAQSVFEELVDDYLETCAAVGKEPSKPFKGSFNVRLSPELHKDLAFAAADKGETLNSVCVTAISQFLAGRNVHTEPTRPCLGDGWLSLSLVTCPITSVLATERGDQGGTAAKCNLEIDAFVPRKEIQHYYLGGEPCLIAPSSDVGHDAFAVIRETIRASNKVALAKAEVDGQKTVLALEPHGKGLIGSRLRSSSEVAQWDRLFHHVRDVKITKDMLDLAKHIVEYQSVPFNIPALEKRWLDNAAEVENKRSGRGANVINLMDALRGSLRGRSRARRKA